MIRRLLLSLGMLLALPIAVFAQQQANPELFILDADTFSRELNAAYSLDRIGIELVDESVGSLESVDSVTVQVRNSRTNTVQDVVLQETDRESSVFHGSLQLIRPFDAQNGSQGFIVSARDELTIRYAAADLQKVLAIVGKPQLQVSPARLYWHLAPAADADAPAASDIIQLNPGDTLTREVTVTNIGDEPSYYKFWFEDFYKDEFDNLQFFSAEDVQSEELKKVAMSTWLSVRGAQRIFLEPGKAQRLTIRFAVPRDATTGGRYAALIFLEDRDPNLKTAEVLAANQEYAIPMAANIGELSKLDLTGEILSVDAGAQAGQESGFTSQRAFFLFGDAAPEWTTSADPTGIGTYRLPIRLQTIFVNNGNAAFKPVGWYSVRNMLGLPAARLEFQNAASAFPSVKKRYEQDMLTDRSAWFGLYRISPDLRDGMGNNLTAGAVWVLIFTASGVIYAASLIALIALLVVYRPWQLIKKQKHIPHHESH